jgi:hypothetical protein
VAPAFLGAGVVKLSSRPAILRIFCLIVVAGADIYSIADLVRLNAINREVGMAPVYDFINKELPTDAVILGDERVWLFTGRKALAMQAPMEYFYLQRPDSEMKFLLGYKDVARQFGAGYVLAGSAVRWDVPFGQAEQVAAAIRSDPGLERIFSQNGVELFRIRTIGEPPSVP